MSSSDKELLILAAKAAGIDYYHQDSMGNLHEKKGGTWNPLTDDGDALRLMVTLKIDVSLYNNCVSVDDAPLEFYDNDPYAAVRRGIVKAAAEIGKNLDES